MEKSPGGPKSTQRTTRNGIHLGTAEEDINWLYSATWLVFKAWVQGIVYGLNRLF